MWGSEPINKDVTHENMQELVQSKEKPKWKKVESKQLSEKDLQQKNIREFNDLKWFIGKGFSYKDNHGLEVEAKTYPKFNSISIQKGILESEDQHGRTLKNFSKVDLRLEVDGTFYANTYQLNNKGLGIKQKNEIKLQPSEVSEYLQAIRNRVNHYKNTVKKTFVELAENQDKKEADESLVALATATILMKKW